METPLFVRRVTRSQVLSSVPNNGGLPFLATRTLDECEKGNTKSVQRQDRSALIDITNDSPIIGLAIGSLATPSSLASKKKAIFQSAPGSGEALLRGQVKSLLLQNVEEGEPRRVAIENRVLFTVDGHSIDSPMPITVVAPTPANTPQVDDFSCGSDDLPSITPVAERILAPQMMIEGKYDGGEDENVITRSLLLDFSEKENSTGGSSCQGDKTNSGKKPSSDDDNSFIWPIQENAKSAMAENGEDECMEWPENEDYYEHEEEVEADEEVMNELCQGMNKMSVGDWPQFTGKHIRFVYNSDDEIEGEEEVKGENDSKSEEPAVASPSS